MRTHYFSNFTQIEFLMIKNVDYFQRKYQYLFITTNNDVLLSSHIDVGIAVIYIIYLCSKCGLSYNPHPYTYS